MLPEIKRGHEGFKAGAKSINPDIEIQEVYTGDWTDTAGAKEAAIGNDMTLAWMLSGIQVMVLVLVLFRQLLKRYVLPRQTVADQKT